MKKFKKQNAITLIALIVTIIVLLILAGISVSLIAGGNGIIGKAEKAVNATIESTAVEEVELAIAEANVEYYLDEASGTLAQYLAEKFSPYGTGSGAEITFEKNGNIQYEGRNGEIILLSMEENGKVEVTQKANGTKIQRTVVYDANGGTGVPTTQNFDRKVTVNVDFSTIPTREGYAFLGWASNSSAESPEYTQNGKNSFTMETKNITLYAVWQDVFIGGDNYGEKANYISPNGCSDWKIFLNDGKNVYLIAGDWIEESKVPVSGTIRTNGNNVYTTDDNGITLVNWMLDTSIWSNFVNTTYAEQATGGPTLAQLVTSANEKLGTSYTEETLPSHWLNDELYKASGYWWLATIIVGEDGNIGAYDVKNDGGVRGSAASYVTDGSIRTLVRLKSGIKATKGTDGIWTFSN